jgi:hypothetical protein
MSRPKSAMNIWTTNETMHKACTVDVPNRAKAVGGRMTEAKNKSKNAE